MSDFAIPEIEKQLSTLRIHRQRHSINMIIRFAIKSTIKMDKNSMNITTSQRNINPGSKKFMEIHMI